jgi:hypothetical protein
VVIVEKDPKCRVLPDLKHNRFTILETNKIMEICNAIRSRIVTLDEKFKNQPFFLFTRNKLPNKGISNPTQNTL